MVLETVEPTQVLAERPGRAPDRGSRARGLEVRAPLAQGRLPRADGTATRERESPAARVSLQQRLFWRNRESAVFVFIFPPLLFLLLGAVYSGKIDGFRAADVLLVGLLGYGCANTAFAGLAITLVIRRESGILKRIRATPLPTATYLTAVLLDARRLHPSDARDHLPGVALYGAQGPENRLGMIPWYCSGSVLRRPRVRRAALIRSAEGASAVVNLIVLPMAFLSGSFGPRAAIPALQWIADVLPLTYLIDLMKDVYLRGDSVLGHPKDIAIVTAWGLAGVAIAWRRFGWSRASVDRTPSGSGDAARKGRRSDHE